MTGLCSKRGLGFSPCGKAWISCTALGPAASHPARAGLRNAERQSHAGGKPCPTLRPPRHQEKVNVAEFGGVSLLKGNKLSCSGRTVALVQGDDIRPTPRQDGTARHGAAVRVALPQGRCGRRYNRIHVAGRGGAGRAVRAHQHGRERVHEVWGGAAVLEEVAQGVLLIQGGDHGRAVML